jgi:GT2 family glycosyltransferase
MSAKEAAAAIVVNWNGGSYLRRCIDCLLAQSSKPERIIVVDNASDDESIESLDACVSGVEVIRLNRNIGFAAANNVALQRTAGCAWIALVNPDAFAAPEWLAQLRDAALSNPEYACFASRILSDAEPTLLDGAGDGYHFSGWSGRRGYNTQAAGHYLNQEEVFSPCAAAALYRREALMEVGGFDESFFCYMEDVDLGFRMRLRGHQCLYVPTAVARHVGSGSTSKYSDVSVYYGHRNVVWTFFKNMPLLLLIVLLIPHLIMNMAGVVRFAKRGQGRLILKAKWAAMKGLIPILRRRREITKHRRSSIRDIAGMLSFWPYG